MTRQAPRVGGPAEVPSETARALSAARLCNGCGRPLVGGRRHRKYCSGRCRAQASRVRRSREKASAFRRLLRWLGVALRQRDADRLTDLLHRLWPDDPGRLE